MTANLSNLPRIVFIAKNVKTTREMSVTALMNRFCEHGYDVTLICETVCSIKRDFRYDHRVKRLSFSMGVKDCATRAELLAHFVSQMPPSIFILTDFSAAYRAFPAIIKAQSEEHKVICLPHYLFASMLNKRPLLLEPLQALAESADVFVTNTVYAHETQNGRLGGKSVWFPYFYPYGEDEYRAAPADGNAVLLFGSSAALITKTMEELASFVQSTPEVTLKIAGRMRKKAVALCRECAESLEIADRVEYGESKRFDELVQDCAFAVVTSRFVFPGNTYIQLAARQLPVLFASAYCEPAFLSADLTQEGSLAGKCAELMANRGGRLGRADLSEAASARTFALWEALVADLAAGRPVSGDPAIPGVDCGEAFMAHFDEIFDREMPEGIKKRFSLKRWLRRCRRRFRKKLRKTLRRSKLSIFIKKRIYYKERQRVQQFAHIQLSPEQVRKLQLLATKMLYEFERICKKYNLRYYVAAGSLLGAVRHGGPIPWDDDVDVTLPRPDYEKFIQVAQDELPDDMVLPLNNYPFCFHRMRIKGTKITRNIKQKGPHGIFLDVIPLDGAAPTQRLKDKHRRKNKRLINLIWHSALPLPFLIPTRKRARIWFKRFLIKYFAPRRLMAWQWKRNAMKYSTDTAEEWVCLPGMHGYAKERFPKEYWGEPVYIPYEGREVPVMREWEQYLTAHYRDYMMPPPKLFRRTHMLFSIDFGKYEQISVEEIEKEVEDYGREAGILC